MTLARAVVLLTICLSLAVTSQVAAQPGGKPAKPVKQPPPPPPAPNVPAVVGASEVHKVTVPSGFIDDAIATDDQRLAYVAADTASKAELHVVTLATGKEQVVDISGVTLQPTGITLVGPRALVLGKLDDGRVHGALVELATVGKKPAGTVVYKVGPATDIAVITRDGKRRLAVHTVTPGDTTRHVVDVVALENGKRVSAGKPFDLDAQNRNASLELTVNHWSDGMTRAHGLKAGDWSKKEDQRLPSMEATYDVVSGKVVGKATIADLFEQRRRYQALEGRMGIDFLRVSWDLKSIELWHRGKSTPVVLDQPMSIYDPKSMQGHVDADGSAWIALTVDRVNAEAVARQKADPQYLDVFRVGADGKGVRKARVLSHLIELRFGMVGDKTRDRMWLLERSSGFQRGGKALTIYRLP